MPNIGFPLLDLNAKVLLVLCVHATTVLFSDCLSVVYSLHIRYHVFNIAHIQLLSLLDSRIEPLQGLPIDLLTAGARLQRLLLVRFILTKRHVFESGILLALGAAGEAGSGTKG